MDSSEAVAQQILGIQTFDILHLFREMTFWGVVAEDMLHDVPCILAASHYPALELAEWLGIRVVVVS